MARNTRGYRMWTRAASLELGEVPLEDAGGVVHDITAAFAAAGSLVATPLRLAVLSAAMAGVATMDATPVMVRTVGADFVAAGDIAASLARLAVLDVDFAGAGALGAALAGGSSPVVIAGALVAAVKLVPPSVLALKLVPEGG